MSYQSKHTGAAIDASVDTTQKILNMIYPVGSIYMSVNNVSPATFIGGTWTALTDRVLIGAGSSYAVNATGGVTSHTHTTAAIALTEAQIPSHSHTRGTMEIKGEMSTVGHTSGITYGIHFDGTSFSGALHKGSQTGTTYAIQQYSGGTRTNSVGFTASKGWTGATSSVGANASHSHGNTGSSSNLPPYLAVYMWKRTA